MKYQLADHVSFTEVDDEAVLLDLNLGAYFSLNHVGALLMARLLNQQDVDTASFAIAEQFQQPPVTVRQDIALLLEQLLEEELIVELAD